MILRILAALLLTCGIASAQLPGMGLLRVESDPPVDPVLAFTPALSSWLAMTNLAAVGTDVTFVPDRTLNFHAAVATNSSNPTATNGGLYFDGSSDLIAFANWNTPTEVLAGYTNATTGICEDPRDDTSWAMDFRLGDIVHFNQSGRQLGRITTSVGVTNAQGIALVPSSGDFWICDPIDSILYKVDSSGATIYSTNILAYAPNGVCYDAATSRIHVLTTLGVIHTYNESDMSYVGFVATVTSEPDGIWRGTNGNFFVSQDGIGFGSSAVLEINPSDGSTINTFPTSWLDAIEHGYQKANGRVVISVDDRHHEVGKRTDYLAFLRSDFTPDDIGRDTTGVTITALIKPSANPTSSRFIMFLADGATANVVRQGLALGVTSGKMTAIGRKNDGGSSGVSTTTPSISTTDYTLLTGVLDYANATATVYTNGVLCSQNTSFFTAGSVTNSVSVLANIGAGANAAYFAGEMVHVFLWNQALDATQVANFKAIITP